MLHKSSFAVWFIFQTFFTGRKLGVGKQINNIRTMMDMGESERGEIEESPVIKTRYMRKEITRGRGGCIRFDVIPTPSFF